MDEDGEVVSAGTDRKPDVQRLATVVNNRLRELGLNQLSASKLGYVSRSTLTLLGKDEDRVPNSRTRDGLDDLLNWQRGSTQAVLDGKDPTPRKPRHGERSPGSAPTVDINAADDYKNLGAWINRRLEQLNMTKSRFAAIGGPSRSSLATMGKRGFSTTPETLERIDTHLMWEPGSALATLKGGEPVALKVPQSAHPALVPLSAIRDRLKVFRARIIRQQDALDQTLRDVDEAMEYLDLVVEDIESTLWVSRTGTPAKGGAADQEDNS